MATSKLSLLLLCHRLATCSCPSRQYQHYLQFNRPLQQCCLSTINCYSSRQHQYSLKLSQHNQLAINKSSRRSSHPVNNCHPSMPCNSYLYPYRLSYSNRLLRVSMLTLLYCLIKHHLLILHILHMHTKQHITPHISPHQLHHFPCGCKHGTLILQSYFHTTLHVHWSSLDTNAS